MLKPLSPAISSSMNSSHRRLIELKINSGKDSRSSTTSYLQGVTRRSILIADDISMNVMIVEKMLEMMLVNSGIDILTATNGLEALECYKREI